MVSHSKPYFFAIVLYDPKNSCILMTYLGRLNFLKKKYIKVALSSAEFSFSFELRTILISSPNYFSQLPISMLKRGIIIPW